MAGAAVRTGFFVAVVNIAAIVSQPPRRATASVAAVTVGAHPVHARFFVAVVDPLAIAAGVATIAGVLQRVDLAVPAADVHDALAVSADRGRRVTNHAASVETPEQRAGGCINGVQALVKAANVDHLAIAAHCRGACNVVAGRKVPEQVPIRSAVRVEVLVQIPYEYNRSIAAQRRRLVVVPSHPARRPNHRLVCSIHRVQSPIPTSRVSRLAVRAQCRRGHAGRGNIPQHAAGCCVERVEQVVGAAADVHDFAVTADCWRK